VVVRSLMSYRKPRIRLSGEGEREYFLGGEQKKSVAEASTSSTGGGGKSSKRTSKAVGGGEESSLSAEDRHHLHIEDIGGTRESSSLRGKESAR